MKSMDYDVVVIGGGIGGSVAASLLSRSGKRVLLVEKERTPRHKPCSGIQFPYFEKLIGSEIPRDMKDTPMCATQLTHTEIDYPPTSKGKKENLVAPFPMANFMRNKFDDWLNKEAIKSGAEFHDKSAVSRVAETDDGIDVSIDTLDEKGTKIGTRTARARYVIAADGTGSVIRKQMRPGDFVAGKAPGYGINYYIKPRDPSKMVIPKTTLLQVWDTKYNNDMFAWVYLKDEPGCTDEKTISGECTNSWVVGTSYTGGDIDEVGKKLLQYVASKYGLDGPILRTEKIQVSLDLADQSRRFAFGDGKNGNILYVGDAAGLIDAVRGLGMDSAALSARKAVSAIIETDRCVTDNGKEQCPRASAIYEERMKGIRDQLAEGSKGARGVFNSNDELSTYLDTQLSLLSGIKKMACTFFNGFKNPDEMELC